MCLSENKEQGKKNKKQKWNESIQVHGCVYPKTKNKKKKKQKNEKKRKKEELKKKEMKKFDR